MVSRRSKESVLEGAAWTIAMSLGARVFGLAGTLALTRHLDPHDYGTVSIASVFIATLGTVVSLGLGQYVVSHPESQSRVTGEATFLHLLLGAVAALVALAATDAAEHHLSAPGLGRYVPALVVVSLLERIAYVPGRVLAREMRFRTLAQRQFFGEIVYVAVALSSAWTGHGAWALVHAALARALVTTATLVSGVPLNAWLWFGWPSLPILRELLHFGVPMSVANTLHWLSRRGDNLLMASLFGPAVAGQYNLAYNLADIPATQIGEPVGDVLLPSLARTQDVEERHAALRRALGWLALVVFPLAAGFGAVAPTLVRAWFPPRWWDVAPMLMVLSALSVLRPVAWLLASYLQAIRRPRVLLRLEFLKVLLLGACIPLLARFGPVAACGAIGVAFAAHLMAAAGTVRRLESLRSRSLLCPLVTPAVGCGALVASVAGTRVLLGGASLSSTWRLVAEIGAGAAAYLATIGWLARRDLVDIRGFIQDAIRRRLRAASSSDRA